MTPTPKGNCITLPDDFEGYNKELFLIPPHYQDSVANVLIPRKCFGITGYKDDMMDLITPQVGWSWTEQRSWPMTSSNGS